MKRTTLILILLAFGLGGFVYFHEIRGATQREEVKQNQQQIFSFSADDVQSLSIKIKDSTLNLERSSTLDKPKWLIKSPISEPANDAIVSYLMDLLVKGKSENTVSTSPEQLHEFGLDQPQATIDIQLKNQQTHKLILGKPNFNNSFLYAQVEPHNINNENENTQKNIPILLVSKDFANAVNRELSEWQEPRKETSKESTQPTEQNTQSQPLPGLPENLPANTNN